MKHFTLILVLFFLVVSCSTSSKENAFEHERSPIDTENTNIEESSYHGDHNHDHGGQDHEHNHHHSDSYDKALAQKLNADKLGMSKYVMAFLRPGPNRSQSKEEVDRLMAAHLENMERMAEDGKLVLAGPFIDAPDLQGIYIFDVESVEEARKLTETDPMIMNGRLLMELHQWYGSSAVKMVNEIHNTIQSTQITQE